jgi:3,4-dihydroxy 2-butanone 4-phosphate synthase/GTP cyclohydrolase II
LDTVEANRRLGFKDDLREYGLGAQMLVDIGVRKMRLLTNNPKKMIGLEGYGLTVEEQIQIEVEPNQYNRYYLECKKLKMGHMLQLGDECNLDPSSSN